MFIIIININPSCFFSFFFLIFFLPLVLALLLACLFAFQTFVAGLIF